MASTTLAERLVRIRRAAGYGEERKAAEFARKLGIRAPSLHDLESGESKSLSGKSLQGYLKVGANPAYIFEGKGLPMLKNIERNLQAQTLVSQILELDSDEIETLEHMVKAFIRAKPGHSGNDPFKQDPPKED